MKELDDAIKLVLAQVPVGYEEVVLRLKTNGDWKAVEFVLACIRERILESGKKTQDGRLFAVLEGFDAVFKILDKIGGVYKTRAATERHVFGLKEMEESIQ